MDSDEAQEPGYSEDTMEAVKARELLHSLTLKGDSVATLEQMREDERY